MSTTSGGGAAKRDPAVGHTRGEARCGPACDRHDRDAAARAAAARPPPTHKHTEHTPPLSLEAKTRHRQKLKTPHLEEDKVGPNKHGGVRPIVGLGAAVKVHAPLAGLRGLELGGGQHILLKERGCDTESFRDRRVWRRNKTEYARRRDG